MDGRLVRRRFGNIFGCLVRRMRSLMFGVGLVTVTVVVRRRRVRIRVRMISCRVVGCLWLRRW